MKMAEVISVAKQKGLTSFSKKKQDLIRAIQVAEKNRDCFNRGESTTCGQKACTWRTDCK
jgi:hypothetical protein